MVMPLQTLLFILVATINISTALHALLTKREPASAVAWVLTCLLFPLVGPALYFLFGINRIQNRARKLRGSLLATTGAAGAIVGGTTNLPPLEQTASRLATNPLTDGNQITPLRNGEEAYPEMLAAIAGAKKKLFLSTYIFDTDETGLQFITALTSASQRGVDVRVIVDGVGEWYSFPHASQLLKKAGVPVTRFLPPRLFPPAMHINLRNHRKILIADSTVAFTGGINIGDRHLADNQTNPARVIDTHFRLAGPVVGQLEQLFLDDWQFCGNDQESVESSPMAAQGATRCRVIADGPDMTLDSILMVLIGAVSLAQREILIMTPYFLPPRSLLVALKSAALRGVSVELVLPGKNNLATVHWACRHILGELIEAGVKVFYQPPPFVHSKLLVVDEKYLQIGSANLDARSLRLNFELAVEGYDQALATELAEQIIGARDRATAITLEQLQQRSPLVRLRDALAWLMSPYL